MFFFYLNFKNLFHEDYLIYILTGHFNDNNAILEGMDFKAQEIDLCLGYF